MKSILFITKPLVYEPLIINLVFRCLKITNGYLIGSYIFKNYKFISPDLLIIRIGFHRTQIGYLFKKLVIFLDNCLKTFPNNHPTFGLNISRINWSFHLFHIANIFINFLKIRTLYLICKLVYSFNFIKIWLFFLKLCISLNVLKLKIQLQNCLNPHQTFEFII